MTHRDRLVISGLILFIFVIMIASLLKMFFPFVIEGGLPMGRSSPLSKSEQVPNTRVGIHAIRPNGTVGFVQDAHDRGTRFGVVKAVDDLGYLYEVKAIDPQVVTVARKTFPDEGAGRVRDPSTDLRAYADVIMAPIFETLDHDPGLRDVVDYWEPINEPLGGGSPTEHYVRLAELMIYCMEIANEADLDLAIFAWNNGTPEHADYVGMIETGVFGVAKAGGHALTVHEGVWNEWPIDKWYPGGLPGGPVWPDAGALSMRYRNLYHLLEPRGEVIPLIVSEWYSGGNYHDPVEVVSRLAWYDDQCRRDDYCLAFLPFTLGPTGQWTGENYEDVYPAILDYMVAQGWVDQTPDATPTPLPDYEFDIYMPILKKD